MCVCGGGGGRHLAEPSNYSVTTVCSLEILRDIDFKKVWERASKY